LAAGQAAASLLVARVTGRAGRGTGLVLGYGIGVLGALVVVAAATQGSFPALLAGSVLLGGANAAIFLSRYAAADIGGPAAGGRALGTVLFATTAGTVAGPALLVPTGRLAQALGLPRLAGLCRRWRLHHSAWPGRWSARPSSPEPAVAPGDAPTAPRMSAQGRRERCATLLADVAEQVGHQLAPGAAAP